MSAPLSSELKTKYNVSARCAGGAPLRCCLCCQAAAAAGSARDGLTWWQSQQWHSQTDIDAAAARARLVRARQLQRLAAPRRGWQGNGAQRRGPSSCDVAVQALTGLPCFARAQVKAVPIRKDDEVTVVRGNFKVWALVARGGGGGVGGGGAGPGPAGTPPPGGRL